jgi:hypothetical protein
MELFYKKDEISLFKDVLPKILNKVLCEESTDTSIAALNDIVYSAMIDVGIKRGRNFVAFPVFEHREDDKTILAMTDVIYKMPATSSVEIKINYKGK